MLSWYQDSMQTSPSFYNKAAFQAQKFPNTLLQTPVESGLYNIQKHMKPFDAPNFIGKFTIDPLPDNSARFNPRFVDKIPGSDLKIPEHLVLKMEPFPHRTQVML